MNSVKLDLRDVPAYIDRENKELVQNVMKQLYDEIRDKTPVRSGKLKDGWELLPEQIRNEVPYAGFIERGTEYISPVGMVATTIENIDNIIKQNIK
jgi:hypothetical protein